MYMYMYVYVYIYIYTYICILVYMYTHVCIIYIYIYISMYVYLYIYIYLYICISLSLYIYIQIYVTHLPLQGLPGRAGHEGARAEQTKQVIKIGEEDPLEERLSEHRTRGRNAVSTAGLLGQGSGKSIAFHRHQYVVERFWVRVGVGGGLDNYSYEERTRLARDQAGSKYIQLH